MLPAFWQLGAVTTALGNDFFFFNQNIYKQNALVNNIHDMALYATPKLQQVRIKSKNAYCGNHHMLSAASPQLLDNE